MRLTKLPWNVPDEEDLDVPRWARIALAARTVRRVQPLLLASWPRAPKKFANAVEEAVAEAELAAAKGAVTPDQRAAGMAAMAAYGGRPMDGAAIAGYVAYAAAHASFAASGPEASHASFAIETAMRAVVYYEEFGETPAPGVIKAALDAIWNDLRLLIRLAKVGKWNYKMPVSLDVFGPMWLKSPKHWPPTIKTRTPAKPKKQYSNSQAQKLGLPRDFVEFLRAGENLEYDPNDAECGLVVLKPYSHLRLGECRIRTDETSVNSRDPNRGKDGDYLVKAVELIGECDAYDPEGILTWFPDFRCYGCWDVDHHKALVFPKAKWLDIVENPAEFLSAQWNGPSDITKPMAPWKHRKFKARN